MDKEEMLLKTYSILSKNPKKNKEPLLSCIKQLIAADPKLGMRCWENCINEHLEEIKEDFGKQSFPYNSLGQILINHFECHLLTEASFENALDIYAKNKNLLDIIYSKSPIYEYTSVSNAISFLIRSNRLQEADNILSAVYKNKTFNKYSNLWNEIIEKFRYRDKYKSSWLYPHVKQPDEISAFCVSWIERIKNEEEQAGAMTFAMQIL